MLRVIIFCDRCNPQGIRYIEQNRSSQRSEHVCPRCQERHSQS